MTGQLAVWDEELPTYVPLRGKPVVNFQRWLAQCRARGYTAWVARDGSHAIAIPGDGR